MYYHSNGIMYTLHGSGTFIHVASGIHVATFGKFKRKNGTWKWLWVKAPYSAKNSLTELAAGTTGECTYSYPGNHIS